jgi:hypothetical protein
VATNRHLTDAEFVDDLNEDVESEIGDDLGSISVSSRDWTVETIVSQIRANNIELNPSFQRRNAWNDRKRSKLIESLLWGIPVPQIVLAESKEKPRSFIVIDGKQRLLTIAGFFDPSIDYWKKPKLSELTQFDELEGVDAETLAKNKSFAEYYRNLMNADIRCTIISNYKSDDILYEIFLRMNTGSTQLSTQELRQVLCKGWFADWLIQKTASHLSLHEVLGIEDSDQRLVDVEILLRCISMELFSENYSGNMKGFLDDSMREVNNEYLPDQIEKVYLRIDRGIRRAIKVMGTKHVGRRVVGEKFEGRFNRALFEVQQYYFSQLPAAAATTSQQTFNMKFVEWVKKTPRFRSSIESTTKSIERTQIRFRLFGSFFNKIFATNIPSPF